MSEKKKKIESQQQFEFCEVCRLNHNNGRRHNYFPKHKSSLSALLTRFSSKLSEVKFFVKNPLPLRPEHAARSRIWCVFCNCDVLELESAFACASAIEHLASNEHMKRVKEFMWRHGGEKDRVDSFRITDVEFAKWEKKCKSLKIEADKAEAVNRVDGTSNDIQNDFNADASFHRNSFDSSNFNIANGVIPLQSFTDERSQIPHSVLYSATEAVTSLRTMYGDIQAGDMHALKNSTGLTKISTISREATERNVHTGAPPPWFDVTKANHIDPTAKHPQFGSSKARKSKLNPKRVGAAWADRRKLEMEMERRGELVSNNYDANWLPNFGGVWQSSTRKESRKEFQAKNKARTEARDEEDKPVIVQPYISKRMRRGTSD